MVVICLPGRPDGGFGQLESNTKPQPVSKRVPDNFELGRGRGSWIRTNDLQYPKQFEKRQLWTGGVKRPHLRWRSVKLG